MLDKIIKVDGVGIFHRGVPSARELGKVTLVYADNARGKSTLSAILRAAASGDAQALTSRPTIGGTRPAAVHLRFQDDAGGRTVKFENGAWDSKAPPLYVFDNAFVEDNVYAASEVGTGQHEALLDFALGTAAVDKRIEGEKHGEAQTAATRARTDAENKLTGYRGSMSLAAFLALQANDQVDQEVTSLESRIANARETAALSARAGLQRFGLPSINWDDFEAVLTSSFQQLQASASEMAEAHFRRQAWSEPPRLSWRPVGVSQAFAA